MRKTLLFGILALHQCTYVSAEQSMLHCIIQMGLVVCAAPDSVYTESDTVNAI